MKWFKHFSDAYTNIKLQTLLADYGLEFYGFYWIVLELVGQQGTNFEIPADKNWKKVLVYITHMPQDKVDIYLQKMAEQNLLDKEKLEKNILFLPKMAEYADDYTERVRRKYGQGTDNVPLEEEVDKKKKRIDKKKITDTAVLGKSFFENPLMAEIQKEFPDRNYKFQFGLMVDWWQKNKGKLPQNISAFTNWLKNTKPDEAMHQERLRKLAREDEERKQNELLATPRASDEKVKAMREKMANIGRAI